MSAERGAAEPWQRYTRVGEIEARPWNESDVRASENNKWRRPDTISVSSADRETILLRPAVGYVARNPANHADQWYIAPDYFAKHYAPAIATPSHAALSQRNEELRDGLSEAIERIGHERHCSVWMWMPMPMAQGQTYTSDDWAAWRNQQVCNCGLDEFLTRIRQLLSKATPTTQESR